MRRLANGLARHTPPALRNALRPVYEIFFPPHTEAMMYRAELFKELLETSPAHRFTGRRLLEIGPKDGLDSNRLASLSPSELVMIDLPEKTANNALWLKSLKCPHNYIEANFMYMPPPAMEGLGRFDLIWCTGVLYHNAEQLRMLRKLYRLLEPGGYLVLESALMRTSRSLRARPLVEIHYPQTHRNTGTATHLPTAPAIRAWLQMVGFGEIHDSDCYRTYNRDVMTQRFACISRKGAEDAGDSYYHKSGLNPKYRFGDSV